MVSLTNATGEKCSFNLGKVLPDQRAGSQWWYEDITHVLCAELEMIQCEPYPNLLANKDRSCLILLHVDDMLVTGEKQFVTSKLLSVLQRHYKVSSNFIQDVGDEISFLKRSHRLLGGGNLVIQSHPRHIEQLMKLAGVKASSRPKKVPGHPLIDEVDNSAALDMAESTVFRSCVGILLYLAADLPHCQHAIRYLSTGMSSSTKQKKDILRHLISLLHGAKDVCLCLDYKGDNVGLHHQYTQKANEVHLEVFSDSDWGSNKQHRKSVSSGYVCCGTALLFSSSRTQKVISLSSGEAEVYAASSAACDGILIGRVIHFATGQTVFIHHLMGSSAASGVLARQGVGRIRHSSCRVLWLQQLVKLKGNLENAIANQADTCHVVCGVSGSSNIADLGTKRLGKVRLAELMRFCNLGFPCHDSFVAFESNTHVISNIKGLKFSASEMADIPHLIAKLSILQSALSRCNAAELSIGEQSVLPAVLAMDYVTSSAVHFVGYVIDYLFVPVELYVWQILALSLMMVVAFIWMIYEIRGYQASLKSWSSLTDDMFNDEMDNRREAFASYMRWKRQQQRTRSWMPGAIIDYFGSLSSGDDFQRAGHGDPTEQTETSAQTSGATAMEVEDGEEMESEPESEKKRRYRDLELTEASDTELWMQVHHHEDMEVNEDNNQHAAGDGLDLEPQLQDMVRARDLALRVYEQRRQEALERGDMEALDTLERNYEWVRFV